MKQKYDIAILGLGVMGQGLTRNLASKGIRVLGWDRHPEKSLAFAQKHSHKNLGVCENFKVMSSQLKSPRKYLLMVPAGEPVDELLAKLKKYLQKGDVVIDGGNSFYKDTFQRGWTLKQKGVEFVGMGISGGEEGALKGSSLMPGGSFESWKALSPLLKKIAAKDFEGKPCVAYMGTDGAGHYVKMVHNGIEYAMMQIMAEAYDLLKNLYDLKADKIADIFEQFYKGKLKSFLFEIAIPVLSHHDKLNKIFLIDKILDKAEQKGTGRWTAIDALNRGIILSSINAAVQTRSASAQKENRIKLSKIYKKTFKKLDTPLKQFSELLEDGLYAGMICIYAEGLNLLATAAKEENWKINLAEVTRIWQGGCIIRADVLKILNKVFQSKSKENHLFFKPEIQKLLKKNITGLRCMVSVGVASGIPISGMSNALNYYDSLTTNPLPANFIQGLRDYFGAHTYERIDRKGVFHTDWDHKNLA